MRETCRIRTACKGAEHALETITFEAAIRLALQGGGAHGAFTWAYSIFCSEASDLQFEGVEGTSAGAMNVVVLADGLMKGGVTARGAGQFWREVAAECALRGGRCAHSMAV